MTSSLNVSYHAGSNVAVVTLDRPRVRNALNAELREALHGALLELDRMNDIHAIVLTGAGPAFCAGLDLTELGSASSTVDVMAFECPIPALATPLIGAINGAAVTGGLELALRCDFLIAAESATFQDTHSTVGVMPGWGLTAALPAAIGYARAKEMSLTGRPIDAATALGWGLVNRVVGTSELLGTTLQLAAMVGSRSSSANSRIKSIYDAGSEVLLAAVTALERRAGVAWQAERIDASTFADARGRLLREGPER